MLAPACLIEKVTQGEASFTSRFETNEGVAKDKILFARIGNQTKTGALSAKAI